MPIVKRSKCRSCSQNNLCEFSIDRQVRGIDRIVVAMEERRGSCQSTYCWR
jgi:hypothetical protein